MTGSESTLDRRRVARVLGLLLLLSLGIWLRTVGIGSGLWLDELISLHYARGEGLGEILLRSRAGLNIHDPLYFVLLNLTTRLLGESDLVVRLPSLIFGGALPLVAYLALRRPWGMGAAAVAAVLITLHPRLVYNSHNARSYAMTEFCLIVVVWGLAGALRTGKARHRVLAWGAALVGVYTHKLFLCLLPALAVAPLLAGSQHQYSRRKLFLDAGAAFLLQLPFMVSLFEAVEGGAAATYWVPRELSLRQVELMLVPGVFVALLVGLVLSLGALARSGPGSWKPAVRAPAAEEGPRRGTTAFFLVVVALHATLVLAMSARGANLLNMRYTTPISLSLCCLLGRVVTSWPRPIAVVALLALTYTPLSLNRQLGPSTWAQEWREAGERLDALEPQRDPVLLWSGNAEAELLLQGSSPDQDLRQLLDCPLRIRPGRPDRELNTVPLPTSWDRPGHRRYFEEVVAPAIAGTRRFFLVVPPGYPPYFEAWLARRFPDARQTLFGGLYPPVVVVVYER